jgi:hypothetical protein
LPFLDGKKLEKPMIDPKAMTIAAEPTNLRKSRRDNLLGPDTFE